ncbi:mechanosensitive ion channel family protein [Paludisphaera soli]|uniref:mechanosensitive ion channel family protein n=1 Tax=Paludisphaera soli TaxID=2712865 RepID=UPI0013E9A715|nr:mechanosensitive ion channel family protein [Paludisphaera soli]
MSSSPAKTAPRLVPRAVAQLSRASVVAAILLVAASGCEYFTSERLAKLAPATGADPASRPAAGPLDTEPTVADPATGEPIHLSAAEVVAMLERIIRGNQRELDDLEPKLAERDEAERARDVFQHLDDLLKSLERERKKALAEGQGPRAEELARQSASLREPWELARERLNLDLRARMLMLERVDILRNVLSHDRQRLAAVLATGDLARFLDPLAPDEPASAPARTAPTDPAAPPPPAAETDKPPAVEIPIVPGVPLVPKAVDAQDQEKPAAAKAEAGGETAKDAAAKVESKDAAEKSEAEPAKAKLPPSKELISAKKELEAKSTAVQKLQERTMTLDARMQNLARSIELVGQLSDVAQRSVENASRTRDFLIAAMAEEKPSTALQAWTHDDPDALGVLNRLVRDSSEDSKRLRARYDEMVEERKLVVDALQRTNLRARSARDVLDQTQEKVEALQSPFSTPNIKAWLLANAPPILGTLVVMSLLYVLVSRYSHKLVQIFASRGIRGSKAERDNRMETLVSVLQNTGSVVVLLGGGSTLLSQVGIPVAPLLGGAAVAGVAVAFGAQNLIKDFFYGFMILLENQYKLKDVVKIGDHSGQVEQITLRMTALRDSEGALHFLPNGSTTSVVNMTHGWSVAVFNVRIAWDEDVDRVIALIQDLGKELRQDPALRLMIVDDLNMMGVDSLTDTAVVILFSIKTLPLQQWNVKREFLRRLRKKFKEKEVRLPPPTPPPV